jgi:hypothetical protein
MSNFFRGSAALFIMLLLLCEGCGSSHDASKYGITAGTSAHEIIARVNRHVEEVTTLHAKGTAAIESPSFSNSATVDLKLHRPDSVRMQITGPFGIRLASVLFAGKRFVFYNNFKNEVMEGEVSQEKMPAMMNIALRPEDIVNAFCGTRTFGADDMVPDSMREADETSTLSFHHGGTVRRYTVDRRSARILQVTELNAAGEALSEEFYEYEQMDDGAMRPQSVRIVNHRMNSALSLFYDSVMLNEPVGRLALSIPDDAVHVQPRGSSTPQ